VPPDAAGAVARRPSGAAAVAPAGLPEVAARAAPWAEVQAGPWAAAPAVPLPQAERPGPAEAMQHAAAVPGGRRLRVAEASASPRPVVATVVVPTAGQREREQPRADSAA